MTASHRDIAIENYGPASTMRVRTLAPREPGPDEIAIDVAYSGVNFADVQMRIGLYPDAPKKPFVPGYEVSGTISAVGNHVKDLEVGDRVVAGTYFGGYASSVTIPSPLPPPPGSASSPPSPAPAPAPPSPPPPPTSRPAGPHADAHIASTTQSCPRVLIGGEPAPGTAGHSTRVNQGVVGCARQPVSSAVGVQPHVPEGWRSHFALASW